MKPRVTACANTQALHGRLSTVVGIPVPDKNLAVIFISLEVEDSRIIENFYEDNINLFIHFLVQSKSKSFASFP